jgi:hypothetical protein
MKMKPALKFIIQLRQAEIELKPNKFRAPFTGRATSTSSFRPIGFRPAPKSSNPAIGINL